MKRVCCDRMADASSVYWNPYNKVVQCHNCGHVFMPVSKFKYIMNRLLRYKWWG